jgi:hypothetical protein
LSSLPSLAAAAGGAARSHGILTKNIADSEVLLSRLGRSSRGGGRRRQGKGGLEEAEQAAAFINLCPSSLGGVRRRG